MANTKSNTFYRTWAAFLLHLWLLLLLQAQRKVHLQWQAWTKVTWLLLLIPPKTAK